MLIAIGKSLEFVGQREGCRFEMQDIPPEDGATYDMICKVDSRVQDSLALALWSSDPPAALARINEGGRCDGGQFEAIQSKSTSNR